MLLQRRMHRSDPTCPVGGQKADLACCAVEAAIQLAADDDPDPDAVAQGQQGEVIDADGEAADAFGQRREIDVILQSQRVR